MGSPPEPEQDKDKPADDMHNALQSSSFVDAESQAQQPAQGAHNPPQRAQHILGACNTAIRGAFHRMKGAIAFIDRHDGAVTALATVAIAGLTFLYVTYAKGQWTTMNHQLEEIRSSSAQTAEMIAIARTQSEASKISAETARQEFMASQRAWVGPIEAKFNEEPSIGKKLSVVVT